MDEPLYRSHECGIVVPEPSEWVADLLPGGCVKLRPTEGNHPNVFHRAMQRLFFGVRWRHEPL